MAIVAWALTSRANLKELLDIASGDTSKDTLLDNLINRATYLIESYCNNRRFASTVYTSQEYDGTGTYYINLRHFPVTALSAQQRNHGTIGSADWNDLESDFVKLIDNGEGPGQVFYQPGFFKGVRNYRFSYTAGYTTIPYDLEQACLELCSYMYNDRKAKGMKSETLGEYSYTKETKTGNMFEDLGIDLVLDKYREPII